MRPQAVRLTDDGIVQVDIVDDASNPLKDIEEGAKAIMEQKAGPYWNPMSQGGRERLEELIFADGTNSCRCSCHMPRAELSEDAFWQFGNKHPQHCSLCNGKPIPTSLKACDNQDPIEQNIFLVDQRKDNLGPDDVELIISDGLNRKKESTMAPDKQKIDLKAQEDDAKRIVDSWPEIRQAVVYFYLNASGKMDLEKAKRVIAKARGG